METNYQVHDLITRIALEDDALAYKKLFLLYYNKLHVFSKSFVHDHELAEEIISDVFLKVWNNRKTLLKIENIHLYLYICTKNHSINALRKNAKFKSFCIDEVSVEFKSIYYNPEQILITSEMYDLLVRAVRSLPPRCQLIFKLIKEDGMTHKETAELLHLSVKTIENQMTIALKKIGFALRFQLNRATSI